MPRISVIMANFNGARFIGAAIASVLDQTLGDLEIIVADDGSSDDSVNIVAAISERDARVRLLANGRLGGPGAARNHALKQARGDWIAIVDSDDILHPERLQRLVEAAEQDGADIALDDLLIFSDDGGEVATLFDAGLGLRPAWVALEQYILSNGLFEKEPALGYGKPLIRRHSFETAGVAYDERLPVGEDYDLVARLLARGLKLRTYPFLTYFYRKHAASISHRLDVKRVRAMIQNAIRFQHEETLNEKERAALRHRQDTLLRAEEFLRLLSHLKTGAFLEALKTLWRRPSIAPLLFQSVHQKVFAGAPKKQRVVTHPIVVISKTMELKELRERIVKTAPDSGADDPILVLAFADLKASLCQSVANLEVRRLKVSGAGSARQEQLFVARNTSGAKAAFADSPAMPLLPYRIDPTIPAAALATAHDESPTA